MIPNTDPKKTDHPRRETGDDRAQPGDVLGIERDGETTGIGDTREDEDKRREQAEEAVRSDRTRGDR